MSRPFSFTKLSITTLVVYWFAIVVGLVLFAVTRNDEVDLAGMWIGGLGGTALGQFLASRDMRLWFVCLILAGFVVLCGPFTPLHNGGLLFWMALIPGTVCGWLSLSDRGSLVAFWFPVVIWMLTILDRGQGALQLESGSAALLGGLAFVFIAFLYARETRRIGLWRTVAPTAIAPPAMPVILKEVPRLRVGFAGWSLLVSACAFGICAWLAPRLWHVESLVPDLYATTTAPEETKRLRRGSARCCQDVHIGESKRSRVKEYFDIGRGHHDDEYEEHFVTQECVVCGPDGLPMDVERYGRYENGWISDHDPEIATGPGYGEPGYGEGYRYGTEGYGEGTNPYASQEGGHAPLSYSPPSYTPPSYTEPSTTPPAWESIPPPQWTPPTDMQARPPEPPPPAPMPTTPSVKPTPPATPPLKPRDRVLSTSQQPPPIAAAPTPVTEPPVPSDVRPPAPSSTTTSTTTQARAATAPPGGGPPVVYWLVVVLASGFAFQLLALGMRPVRRLLTLRHLRKPFWTETVDQRISNWWHLVLVGLRDAGWRTTSGEAPRELAKRLEIDAVERAAAILERARHGVGIEAADLDEMREVSEQAYRASRERTSAFARFIGWFRRPLV